MARIIWITLFVITCFGWDDGLLRAADRARAREIGIETGTLETGTLNSITDVPGVRVGHATIIRGDRVRTGVTVILPHGDNLFRYKVPAAIHFYNAFGKLAGYTQVEELGNIETPIVLTNTLSVATCVTAVIRYTLSQEGNEDVRSVNAVVGETNDGFLNDIRGLHVGETDVFRAISNALPGPVEEGSVGAGTGTSAFGFKGGIGTSSRITPEMNGTRYTIGVLVQSNFGRFLTIKGVPFSKAAKRLTGGDGSCMIVIATDAPLSVRNLKRMAKRSFAGMARTCSVMSNSSGDYAIAFSTCCRIPDREDVQLPRHRNEIHNDSMTILFQAVEEATEEAIYNSLFMAETIRGYQGHIRQAIPLDKVVSIMKRHRMIRHQK